MLTSSQVSMMMTQQTQQFAGQAAYAHTISSQMPGMYSAPGFSYGGGAPLGRDFGSNFGGAAISAAGGAAQFGIGAASIAAGMGMLGPANFALDPFAGGGAMYRLGGRMGMGMMGRLGMGAIGMAPAAIGIGLASHAIGSMVGGAQEQSAVDNVLGQNFNFLNSSTGGRGFSRGQSMAIGDMMRQMQALPELMTNMGELTSIMNKMSQMGLMQGVRDVQTFKQKFSEGIKTLKEMAKVMGSTMEEALPMFGEIRRSGFYQTSDILRNAMNRQITSGITGMNQGQIAQVAQSGSQMGFATGGSRKTGAQHALRVANQLGMANQMGILSNDDILEMTGMEGAAGIQALSQQLTHAGYRMSRGALGTATSIALAEIEDGKFTGEMDEDLIDRFRKGDISKSELMRMARRKVRTRGAKMSYVANRGRLRSEMAGQLGVEGQMQMLQTILGERGFENPDALRIVSQGFGLNEREAGLLVDLGQRMPDIGIELQQRGRAEAKRIAQESFMKENYSWDAVKRKAGKRIENAITAPFKQMGADMRNAINTAVDEFVDDITGRYKVQLTQGMSDLTRGAMGGIGGYRSRMASMIRRHSGALTSMAGMGQDFTPGLAGHLTDMLTGRTTAGEGIADAMRLSTVGSRALVEDFNESRDFSISDARRGGYHVLARDRDIFSQDEFTLVSDQGRRRFMQDMTALSSGAETETLRSLAANLKKVEGFSFFSDARKQLMEDFSMMRSSSSFQGLKGKDRVAAMGQAMREIGRSRGGRSAFSRLRMMGYSDADILAFAARGEGGGDMGLLGAFGEMGDAAMFTDGGLAAVAKSVEESEKNLHRVFGDRGRAESFKSLMKGRMGTGAGEVMSSFLGGGDIAGDRISTYDSAVGGYTVKGGTTIREGDLQDVMSLSGRARLEEIQSIADEASRNKMRSLAAGIDEYRSGGGTFKFKEYSQQEMENFLRVQAVKKAKGEKLSEGAQKIIAAQQAAFNSVYTQQVASDAIEKGKQGRTDFTDAELEVLKKMGYEDPSSFTKEEAKKWGDFKDLLNSSNLDPNKKAELRKYLGNLEKMGLGEVVKRFRDSGERTIKETERLRSSGLLTNKKALGILSDIEGRAGRMAGMTDAQGIASAFGIQLNGMGPARQSVQEDLGDIALQITQLKDEEARRLLTSTDESLSAAVSRADFVQSMGRRRGRRLRLSDLGITKDAAFESGLEGEYQHLSQFFDEKTGRIKRGSLDEVTKYLAGKEGQQLLTAAGAEQRSQYANQAEIAQHMAEFSKNTATLAEYVAILKNEKEPKKED